MVNCGRGNEAHAPICTMTDIYKTEPCAHTGREKRKKYVFVCVCVYTEFYASGPWTLIEKHGVIVNPAFALQTHRAATERETK